MKEYLKEKKYFDIDISQDFSRLIANAIENNGKEEVLKLIKYIITIESYNFPAAYLLAKDELGGIIFHATNTAEMDDIKNIKKYIGDERAEQYVNWLRVENRKLKDTIQAINEMNSVLQECKVTEIDLKLANRCRSFVNRMQDVFVYGRYTGMMFFYAYWKENNQIREENKPWWIINMASPIMDDIIIDIDAAEDSTIQKEKRRRENNHTIKVHLRNIFSIDVDELNIDENQYNKLCDIIESLKYNLGTIGENNIKLLEAKEAKENFIKKKNWDKSMVKMFEEKEWEINVERDKICSKKDKSKHEQDMARIRIEEKLNEQKKIQKKNGWSDDDIATIRKLNKNIEEIQCNSNPKKRSSLQFFKMFGKYNVGVGEIRRRYSKETWSRNGMPLDLFDNSGTNILPSVSPEITTYQKVIASFIYELKNAASNTKTGMYKIYDDAAYEIWKWYDLFPRLIEQEYIDHWGEGLEEFLNNGKPIFQIQTKDKGESMKNNIFSILLLELLKMKLYNDVRSTRYIVDNSNVIMKELYGNAKECYKELKRITRNPFVNIMGVDAAYLKMTYKELYEYIIGNEEIKQLMLQLLHHVDDLENVFHKAHLLMSIIIHPWLNRVSIFQFITIMQCCAESGDSSITIRHYGMKRGKRKVTLNTIMRRPNDNREKEIRLFLIYLAQRRNLLNEVSYREVDLIEKYILAQRKNVLDDIMNIKCWGDINENFSTKEEVPQRLIFQGNEYKKMN